MSEFNKATILYHLNSYLSLCDKHESEIDSVYKDRNLSELGREEKLSRIKDTYKEKAEAHKSKVAYTIDHAIEQIKYNRQKTTAQALKDVSRQIGLQNVLEMIKKNVIISVEDFKGIVSVYKNDIGALSLIEATITSSKIPFEKKALFSSCVPNDNIEKNINLLLRTKEHILYYMDVFYRMGIESQVESVKRLYADDLTLADS